MTREIPILDSCDVLVCGGGFGGISAALAAARLGKRVILLEKQYVLGGLGTAGLITSSGNSSSTVVTRFCTFTAATSGSVPTLK